MSHPEVSSPCTGESQNLEECIRNRIARITYLPTSTAVAIKFFELGRNPEAEPAEYAEVLGSDPALSAKLLALANSSWMGVRTRVTRPLTAVNLLGLQSVRTLALSCCLAGLHSDLHLDEKTSAELWAASLTRAVAARAFAALVDERVTEEAFIGALFSDLGQTVMHSCAPEQMAALMSDTTLDGSARLAAERKIFKLDHAEIGCAIARRLQVPALYTGAIAFHHNHAELRDVVSDPALADAIYVAGFFPHHLEVWNSADAARLRDFYTSHAAAGKLSLEAYLDRVSAECNHMRTFFDQGPSPRARLAELLEVATRELADDTSRLVGSVNELMVQVASAGKEVTEIREEQGRLELAAFADSLTGTLNREGFSRDAKAALVQACRDDKPFALLYIDLDKFKQINDQHSHAVGDAALRHLVEHVRRCIRRSDLLARMGGDEFVALLTNCPYADAHVVAERIRVEMKDYPLSTSSGDQIRLSLSLGLLWVKPDGRKHALEQLLPAADQLMYDAKHAGGNRIHFARVTGPHAATPAV